MSKFDFSAGVARLSSAMTTGGGEVPFIAQMHEFAMRESGIPGDEFYTDGKKFVRGVCEVAERFGFDTPSFIWDAYNVEPAFQQHFIEAIAIPHGADAFPNLQRIVKLPDNKSTQDKKGENTISRRQQRKLKLAGI